MDIGRNVDCPCGSGRKFNHCCGASGPHASSVAERPPLPYVVTSAAGVVAEPPPGAASPMSDGGPSLLHARLGALHAALQDPAADVGKALRQVPGRGNLLDAMLLEAIDQILFHGHAAELLDWLARVLPRPSRAKWEAELAGHTPRMMAVELALAQAAAGGMDKIEPTLYASLARFTKDPPAALDVVLEAHHRLPPDALDRTRYRFDRFGIELVGSFVVLTMRFAHLLAAHWGWPVSRALLARAEIESLLLSPLDAMFELDGLHACRDCAMTAPPRQDLGTGATALAIDTNVLILTWPNRMEAPGGPFRGAALLEALPLWVQFLEGLKLHDGKLTRRRLEAIDRTSRLLAPSLRMANAAIEDRALAAAAQRLERGRPPAS